MNKRRQGYGLAIINIKNTGVPGGGFCAGGLAMVRGFATLN